MILSGEVSHRVTGDESRRRKTRSRSPAVRWTTSRAFRRLGAALKTPLGGMPYSATIGVAATVGGAVAGFLLTYLWTSVRVRELLEESERQSQRDVVPKLLNRTIAEAKGGHRLYIAPARHA